MANFHFVNLYHLLQFTVHQFYRIFVRTMSFFFSRRDKEKENDYAIYMSRHG